MRGRGLWIFGVLRDAIAAGMAGRQPAGILIHAGGWTAWVTPARAARRASSFV